MRIRDVNKVELVKEKAIELLVKVGFEGFTMGKLAKECGISVATLYIYYKDKDDLILQVGMEETERMSVLMLEDFDPEAPFAIGLRQQWKKPGKLHVGKSTICTDDGTTANLHLSGKDF
jgi:TetR/AcrR family transcriptional repressor of multidrug resistance operon